MPEHANEQADDDDQIRMSDGKRWHVITAPIPSEPEHAFGATSSPGLILSLRSEDDHLVFLQPRHDFNLRGGLQARA